jgi:hypothetical protein
MAQKTQLGLTIIFAGLGLVAVGALVALGALSWFGRLPGDIRVERPGTRFYAPITSMILLSVALSAVAVLIRRLWR